MKIVELTRTRVVFPATVTSTRAKHAVPTKKVTNERRTSEQDRRQEHRAEVQSVLHWVHREPAERLRIRIAVVKRVNVFVDAAEVDEPVHEVKMNILTR